MIGNHLSNQVYSLITYIQVGDVIQVGDDVSQVGDDVSQNVLQW